MKRVIVDSDIIIAAMILVVVGMLGGNLFLLVSIRDKISLLDRRFNAQPHKFMRISDWLESKKDIKQKVKDGG